MDYISAYWRIDQGDFFAPQLKSLKEQQTVVSIRQYW